MNQLQEVALDVFEALGTPVALSCAILLRSGELHQLSTKKVDPSLYVDSLAYLADAQAVALLKKLETDEDCDRLTKQAKHDFIELEKKCKSTNLYMSHIQNVIDYPLESDSSADQAVARMLRVARKKIRHVLGSCPLDIQGNFGPGSTYQLTSQDASTLHKLVTLPETTAGAAHHVKNLAESAWFRYHAEDSFFEDNDIDSFIDLPLVRGNRWASVPKDSSKRRSIAIEPCLNLWFQLGIGKFMKRRLSRIGLLLVPQRLEITPGWIREYGLESQHVHKCWAKEASVSNDYATLDLSAASDTISFNLVKLLLPDDWFQTLSQLRSPSIEIDKQVYLLEKFSSMGNGFNFELETLIFWAICESVKTIQGYSGAHSVYGDDIIVPTHWVKDVIAALTVCGFTLNTSKSYWSGPFRESCGGDFFNGYDVRPVYVKVNPTDPLEIIVFHNLLVRIHQRFPIPRAINKVRGWLPYDVRRCKGPTSLGDLVLHAEDPLIRMDPRHPGCRQIRVALPQGLSIPLNRVDDRAIIVAALYGLPSDGCPIRGSKGYRTTWIPFP